MTTGVPAALKNPGRRVRTEKNGGLLDIQETSGKVATCITKNCRYFKSEEMEPGTQKRNKSKVRKRKRE